MRGRVLNWAACLLGLMILFCACTSQPAWQEQYDLGMRYLSESNYEEAILAFTAAIEIEPNRAETYLYLVQSYLSAGDAESAEQIRQQGYAATGDERLSRSLQDGWFYEDGQVPFEQRITYRDFSLLSETDQNKLRQLVQALQAGEAEPVRELLNSSLPPQLSTTVDGMRVVLFIARDGTYQEYIAKWMESSGQRVDNEVYVQDVASASVYPQEGTGYNASFLQSLLIPEVDSMPQQVLYLQQQEYRDWQAEGAWRAWEELLYADGTQADLVFEGIIENGVSRTIRSVEEYEDGRITIEYDENQELARTIQEDENSRIVVEYDEEGTPTAGYMVFPDGRTIELNLSETME